MEESVHKKGQIALEPFGLTATAEEIQGYFASSAFLQSQNLDSGAEAIQCRGNLLDFSRLTFNSYYASVLADFLRRKALAASKSFTFETVMSSPDKVELLREAQALGFRTYLYFISTEDPAINLDRVRNRVADGGHDVPEDKVISRYRRSLELLPEAIVYTNRAYFFDTSKESRFFAEATDGKQIELKTDKIPIWFVPTWQRFALKETR
ncbi:MAG TPA: hypothetical protein VGP68_18410 [Gemmataceae bacterium]|nr:hypothetical protein [Gemmataceae bacterium]